MCKEGQTDTGPDRSESAPLAMAHAADFRIQVAPATALAELAARAELAGGSLAQAAALVPSGLLAQARAAETEGQTADCTIRAASAAHLAEAVARLETWLISTRGAELRKAKSSAAALRAVAHVAYAHARCSEEATEMSEDPAAARRPIAPAVEMELPSDSFVGHVVGRNLLCASPARRTRQRVPHSRPGDESAYRGQAGRPSRRRRSHRGQGPLPGIHNDLPVLEIPHSCRAWTPSAANRSARSSLTAAVPACLLGF